MSLTATSAVFSATSCRSSTFVFENLPKIRGDLFSSSHNTRSIILFFPRRHGGKFLIVQKAFRSLCAYHCGWTPQDSPDPAESSRRAKRQRSPSPNVGRVNPPFYKRPTLTGLHGETAEVVRPRQDQHDQSPVESPQSTDSTITVAEPTPWIFDLSEEGTSRALLSFIMLFLEHSRMYTQVFWRSRTKNSVQCWMHLRR